MEKTHNKFFTFLRRNLAYLVVALCVLAIGLATILTAVYKEGQIQDTSAIPDNDIIIDEPVISEPDDPSDLPVDAPVNPEPEIITFITPVQNFTSVEYFNQMPVFNATLGRYSNHTATDFYASEGENVYAVYDGVVVGVENSLLTGYSVTIDHGEGLKTVYNSLSEDVLVTVGESVNQGDVIGAVSTTNRQEYKSGAHLHFEVHENGVSVDPATYLIFDEK